MNRDWDTRRGLRMLICFAALFCMSINMASARQKNVVVVDDFDRDVQNRLGGYRNAFGRGTSHATILRDSSVHRGPAGRSLRIVASKSKEGFCGAWIHLFDMKRARPKYFDATRFGFLTFWVKGASGGESFIVKLADRRWIEKEDSLEWFKIEAALPDGVTKDWQEVVVPLDLHENHFATREMGGITIEFSTPGEHTIFIDDLCLKTESHLKTPLSRKRPAKSKESQRPRAMWVWQARSLLYDAEWRASLLEFSTQQNINVLWTQLHYTLARSDKSDKVLCRLDGETQLREFLKQAHQRGIQVHALDGDPSFCQRESHEMPLALVDAILRFNKASAADERFDGIHFDNEPYLLPLWRDPKTREKLLEEFLELNAECQRRVDESPDLEFGVDLPFWWNQLDRQTQRPQADVSFNGKRQPASLHCIELLDNVGIMNYRDRADGADGMIAHGRDLLRFADRVDGAQLYMGVETFAHRPIEVWFAFGVERQEFQNTILEQHRELFRAGRFEDCRIRTFDDGEYVHVGLEMPKDADLHDAAQQSMSAFTTQLRKSLKTMRRSELRELLPKIETTINARPQWQEFAIRPVPLLTSKKVWPGFSARFTMLPKVTFADDTPKHFGEQTIAAEQYFNRHKSYQGLAIHYYSTYRRLLEK